jgi:purine-binding chemotaxis protein CheW
VVDLVKIRKKKAEKKAEEAKVDAAQQKADATPSDAGTTSPAAGSTQQPSNSATQQPSPQQPAKATPQAPPDNLTTRQPDTQPSKLEKFKQQAGKRRELHKAADLDATISQLELLTFIMAREQYAVDIERIIEIVTPRPVTRIPNADPSVLGIISLRGTIVTLVDVRRKLRHDAAVSEDADTRVVVIDYRNEMIGFVVDRVLRVVKAAADDIEPHPVVHATELDESVRGVFRAGGALTILLDLDKLLDSRALAATTA